MTQHRLHPPGTPCWVETLQQDPLAAQAFYGSLLGWTFDGDEARLDGRLVAGLVQAPPGTPALWAIHIAVEDIGSGIRRVESAGGSSLTGPLPRDAAGQYAVVTDSTGVAFCLWEAAERTGVETTEMPGAWAMSSLHSPDVAAATAFYGDVFGWSLEPGPAFSTWHLEDRVVAVVTAASTAVPAHWAVAFAVDSPDRVAAQATQLGGSVLMPATDTPGFRSAVIADPQGGVLAITTRGGDSHD